MKRLVKLSDDRLGNKMLYVLKEEYQGFGLYQRKSTNGYLIHQDYMITNDNITIQCQSYNEIIKEELLDAIDNYNNNGNFELKVFKRSENLYYVHPNGNFLI